MIRTLFATNFQGIGRAKVRLGSVTELIGPNAAGKTSLAEAIEFVLLGEPTRGGVLSDVIREGEDACEVELVLDDGERTTLGRKRTASGSSQCLVDEGVARAVAFDELVRDRIGPKDAIRSALRSGGLLAMKPADLQKFLVALTGARFDAASITDALGEEVVAAAQRTRLTLPTNLDFKPFEERAIVARQEAKRRLRERIADLDRLPIPEHDPDDVEESAVASRIRALRAALKDSIRAEAACDASAQAQRHEMIESLRARIAELEPLAEGEAAAPARPAAEVERQLASVRRDATRAEADLERARRDAEQERPLAEACTEKDRDLARTVHSMDSALARAEAELDAARRRLRNAADERERLEQRLASTPKAGVCLAACEHCSVANAAKDRTALEQDLRAAQKSEQEKQRSFDVAEREHRDAQETAEAAQLAHDRVRAAEHLTETERRIATLEETARSARETEAKLVEELDFARGAERAGHDLRERRRELDLCRSRLAALEEAPAPQPPEESSASLERRIADAERLLEAVRQRDARARAEEAVEAERQMVRDTDLVAKALGPQGAKARLIAEGVGPFVRAANEALELLRLPWRVAIDPDAFGIVVKRRETTLRPEQLSDGHRTRLLFALQYAVARLAGVGLIVLDRVELLDEDGRHTLDLLVDQCISAGIQVLLLRHGAPPATVPAGVTAYAVVDGGAKRIPNESTTTAIAGAEVWA